MDQPNGQRGPVCAGPGADWNGCANVPDRSVIMPPIQGASLVGPVATICQECAEVLGAAFNRWYTNNSVGAPWRANQHKPEYAANIQALAPDRAMKGPFYREVPR